MSDQTLLQDTFNTLGLGFVIETEKNRNTLKTVTKLVIRSEFDGVDGYIGFFVEHLFDEQGNFISMGIFE